MKIKDPGFLEIIFQLLTVFHRLKVMGGGMLKSTSNPGHYLGSLEWLCDLTQIKYNPEMRMAMEYLKTKGALEYVGPTSYDDGELWYDWKYGKRFTIVFDHIIQLCKQAMGMEHPALSLEFDPTTGRAAFRACKKFRLNGNAYKFLNYLVNRAKEMGGDAGKIFLSGEDLRTVVFLEVKKPSVFLARLKQDLKIRKKDDFISVVGGRFCINLAKVSQEV